MLEATLDARRDKPGKPISGRIMQDVPLPDGAKISEHSRIVGHMVSVSSGAAAQLVLRFDYVEISGRHVPINAHLLALASMNEVFQAKLPTNSIDDYGTSTSDWNTIQIGGAGVFRGNGEVISDGAVVGRATHYGAVTARLVAAPKRGCPASDSREQALWLFSPDVCGVYGFDSLKILRRGSTDPIGEITLESGGNIRIDGGSGWLLRSDARQGAGNRNEDDWRGWRTGTGIDHRLLPPAD
jgi:hypothetical protein